MPEKTQEQQEIDIRVKNFDRDFQELQKKYQLRAISQVIFPGDAVLTVPIQVMPFMGDPLTQGAENPAADQATKPE